MKQLLKTILPQSVILSVRDKNDRKSLNFIQRLSFNEAHLRESHHINLSDILDDPDIENSWIADKQAIMAHFGHDDRWGGINPGDRRALYSLIRGLKPKSVLEVGTHIGASTLYIAKALKQIDDTKLTTVDILDVNAQDAPWFHIGMPYSPRENAQKLDCDDVIEFVAKRSLDYLKTTSQTFDFIFLDGDHKAGTVYQEVSAALDVLNEGGVILLHDYYPDAHPLFPDNNIIYGPFRALERVTHENPQISVLPLGELPWTTKQNVNKTSLALLLRA